MFSSIRRYTVEGGSVEELTRRVAEGFVPLVRRMKGFKGYYLVSGGQDVSYCNERIRNGRTSDCLQRDSRRLG